MNRVLILAAVILILNSLVMGYLTYKINSLKTQLANCNDMVACVSVPDTTLSKESLQQYLQSINAKFPNLMYAQAIQESGHELNSPLVVSNNNLFGMKHPTQRATISTGQTNGYATYPCWTSSVVDYILWLQIYCSSCKTEEEMLDTLQRIYAEDPNYKERIKSLMVN